MPSMNIHTIDLEFQGTKQVVACYALESNEGWVLVDPGPASCIPALERGLATLGADVSELRAIVLTHIHLDHAGASGTLLERNSAELLVHTKGAKHLISPERLLSSATKIYGDQMERLWGEMLPIDPLRVRAISGDPAETVSIANLELEAFYTPGHAVHHLAWKCGDALFCGDVAGIRMISAQSSRPPTPPPDIDLEAWRSSLDTLEGLGAKTLYLTHFGAFEDVESHLKDFRLNLERDFSVARAGIEKGLQGEDLYAYFRGRVESDLYLEGGTELVDRYQMNAPLWMSLQGLERYWGKKLLKE